MKIGDKIAHRRKELGYTLEQVGEMVGVGKSTVRKWETGYIQNMRRDKIALLADALRMSPAELIDDTFQSTPSTRREETDAPSLTPEQQAKERIHELVDKLSPADLARVEAVIDAFLSTQGARGPEDQ